MKFANAIGFNIIWFGLVTLQNDFIVFAVILLLIHLLLVDNKIQEISLIISVASIGIAVDTGLMLMGVLYFEQYQLFIPPWLVSLWFVFAATLNHAFAFLKHVSVTAVACLALLAPASYLAGKQLNAVSFNLPTIYALCILAVCWCVMLPVFVYLAKSSELEIYYEK